MRRRLAASSLPYLALASALLLTAIASRAASGGHGAGLVVAAGLLISGALFAATWLEARSRAAAEVVSAELLNTRAALRESEASLRPLFFSNPLPMWVYDAATLVFLEVNPAAVAHYGYSRDEFLAMRITDLRPDGDRPRLSDGVAGIPGAGASAVRRPVGSWRHRLKDGRVRDVDVVSHAIDYSGRPVMLAVAIDVTDLKQAQQALARSAERLEVLHEIDRAVIAAKSPLATAEAVIRRLRDLLGVPRVIVNMFDLAAGEAEWLVAAGRRRVHLGPGVRFPLLLMGDVEGLRRGELQVVDTTALPDGPEVDALLASGVRTYMVVPMIAGGELIGGLSFGGEPREFPPEQVAIAQEAATQLAIAITQARLSERVRQQAVELEERVQERTRELEAALRELEAFAYTVSHDLKTPLRGMEGFARALEQDYGDRLDDSGRHYLEMIRGSASRMGQLIEDLLRYSRMDHRAAERRPVPLALLVDALGKDFAEDLQARGLTLTRDLAAPEVPGEREGLREALANLLANAIKFSRGPGSTIAIRSYRQSGEVVISVADQGIGFDMKYHDRIFGIFERLHGQEAYPGTGVGLAIVRKVAERHGGRVWAESEPGRGSVFSLALPAPGDISSG